MVVEKPLVVKNVSKTVDGGGQRPTANGGRRTAMDGGWWQEQYSSRSEQ